MNKPCRRTHHRWSWHSANDLSVFLRNRRFGRFDEIRVPDRLWHSNGINGKTRRTTCVADNFRLILCDCTLARILSIEIMAGGRRRDAAHFNHQNRELRSAWSKCTVFAAHLPSSTQPHRYYFALWLHSVHRALGNCRRLHVASTWIVRLWQNDWKSFGSDTSVKCAGR